MGKRPSHIKLFGVRKKLRVDPCNTDQKSQKQDMSVSDSEDDSQSNTSDIEETPSYGSEEDLSGCEHYVDDKNSENSSDNGDEDTTPKSQESVSRTSSVEIIKEIFITKTDDANKLRKIKKLKNECKNDFWLGGRFFMVDDDKSIEKDNRNVIASCQIFQRQYAGPYDVSSNFTKHLKVF